MTARTHTGIPHWGDHAEAEPVGALERWEEADEKASKFIAEVSAMSGIPLRFLCGGHTEAVIKQFHEAPLTISAGCQVIDEPFDDEFDPDEVDDIVDAWREKARKFNAKMRGVAAKLDALHSSPTDGRLTFDAAWREAEVLLSIGRRSANIDRLEALREKRRDDPRIHFGRTPLPPNPDKIKVGSPVYIEDDDWCMGGAECTVIGLRSCGGIKLADIVEDGDNLKRTVYVSQLTLRASRGPST